MNRHDIDRLLVYIRARDGRHVDNAVALAWLDDLGDIGYDEAKQAVGEHYRTSDERIMPAHIRHRVRQAALAQAPGGYGSHCGRTGCPCTHTGGCQAGWIDNSPTDVQADLFDESDPQAPPVRVLYDSVRPCPACAPRRAEILEETPDRRRAQQKLRLRKDR